MTTIITVRKLPEHVKKQLDARAGRNGRSTEAEVRAILTDAVTNDLETGTALARFARAHRLDLAEAMGLPIGAPA